MVTRRVLAALLLALACAALEPAAAETPDELFQRANAAYEEQDWTAAARDYRMLLRYRVSDPRVEYNLGNAEFRLGHLGQAILHWERARRLDPTDSEVRANLELARSMIFDRVETPAEPFLLRGLRTLEDRLGPDRHAWLALGLVWVAASLVAWCSARPGGWNPLAGWILTALLLLLALVGLSWYITHQRLEGSRDAVVLTDVAEVLAGPGENNAALFTVHEGLTLEVVTERDEWIQVTAPNGFTGWVSRESVEVV